MKLLIVTESTTMQKTLEHVGHELGFTEIVIMPATRLAIEMMNFAIKGYPTHVIFNYDDIHPLRGRNNSIIWEHFCEDVRTMSPSTRIVRLGFLQVADPTYVRLPVSMKELRRHLGLA